MTALLSTATRWVTYWLAEHPTIVGFRWSHAQSWGSTWSFLFSAITIYLLLSLTLHILLRRLLALRTPIPLGPVPAVHSLIMAIISATIFLGLALSSAAEIRDTRWLWRRTGTTTFRWLLCFPLGTRPTGRVFFWSYAFYLSRFLHLLRTFFLIMRRPRQGLPVTRLFNHSTLVFMSFLWLEFSQSFQVMAILSTTLVYVVIYGYRFWVGVGLPTPAKPSFPVVLNCQMLLLGCHLLCHLGVLLLHFLPFLKGGGCNGMGAWVFNSVLNVALLLLFLNCYVRAVIARRKGLVSIDDDGTYNNNNISSGNSNHNHHHHQPSKFDHDKDLDLKKDR